MDRLLLSNIESYKFHFQCIEWCRLNETQPKVKLLKMKYRLYTAPRTPANELTHPYAHAQTNTKIKMKQIGWHMNEAQKEQKQENTRDHTNNIKSN